MIGVPVMEGYSRQIVEISIQIMRDFFFNINFDNRFCTITCRIFSYSDGNNLLFEKDKTHSWVKLTEDQRKYFGKSLFYIKSSRV